MSAKDTADAILRDFRTSMATTSVYIFDTEVSAQAVLDAMEKPDYLIAKRPFGHMLTMTMVDTDERRLTI